MYEVSPRSCFDVNESMYSPVACWDNVSQEFVERENYTCHLLLGPFERLLVDESKFLFHLSGISLETSSREPLR